MSNCQSCNSELNIISRITRITRREKLCMLEGKLFNSETTDIRDVAKTYECGKCGAELNVTDAFEEVLDRY